MNGLWKDVAEKLKLNDDMLKQYSYTVLGESTVIIEGQKNLLSVSEKEISFVYGDKILTVYGENLHIKVISKGFASVEGKISRVECR